MGARLGDAVLDLGSVPVDVKECVRERDEVNVGVPTVLVGEGVNVSERCGVAEDEVLPVGEYESVRL